MNFFERKTPNLAASNGTNPAPEVAPSGNSPRDEAILDAQSASEKIRKTHKKRTPTADEAKAAKIAEDLEKIFNPALWTPLATLPANVMLAWTGNEKLWNIPDKEAHTMGQSISMAMRYLGVHDPKALALLMAAASVMMVYSPRVIKQMAITRAQKERDKPPEKWERNG